MIATHAETVVGERASIMLLGIGSINRIDILTREPGALERMLL